MSRARLTMLVRLGGAAALALMAAGCSGGSGTGNAAAVENMSLGYQQNIRGNFTQAREYDCSALSAGETSLPDAHLKCAIALSAIGEREDARAQLAQAEAQLSGSTDPIALALLRNTRMALALDDGDVAVVLDTPRVTGGAETQLALATADASTIVVGSEGVAEWNSNYAGYGSPLDAAGSATASERLGILDAQYYYLRASAFLRPPAVRTANAKSELGAAQTLMDGVRQRQTWLRSDIALLRARIAVEEGDFAGAANQLAVAIPEERRALGETPRLARMFLVLATAQRGLGQGGEAAGSEQAALEILGRHANALGGDPALLEPLLAAALESGAKEQFFEIAQFVTSASAAADASRSAARLAAGDGDLSALIRRTQDLANQVVALKTRRERLLAQDGDHASELAQIESDLASATAELNSAEAERDQRFPEYAQLISNRTTLAALQGALLPGEVYVRVFFVKGTAYGYLVDQSGIVEIYRANLTAQQAAETVALVRVLSGAGAGLPSFDPEPAHRLFQALFGPVKAQMLAADAIVFEPHRELGTLPIGVLLTDAPDAGAAARAASAEDYSGFPFLVKTAALSTSIGGASFVSTRSSASSADQPLAGFGDFEPADPSRVMQALAAAGLPQTEICAAEMSALLGQNRLAGTRPELEQVAAALGAGSGALQLGADFTDQAVLGRGDLTRYRVIYFATHGVLPTGNRCVTEPGLITSLGAEGDGYLSFSDVIGGAGTNGLALDADVVVISACDSAGQAGSAQSRNLGLAGGGDALSGLVRSFFYAGARSVLAANWKVDDTATVALMTRTFQNAATGMTIAQSLQKAQESMIAAPATSHPFYWGAFADIGDGSRRIAGGT